MKPSKLAPTLALSTLLLAGCAARPIHPGAANVFDSTSYDTLNIAHGVIENTKTDLAAGEFSTTLVPAIKSALNDLIAAYNVADNAYLAYHAAATGTGATQAQIDAVTAGLTKVNSSTAALVTIKGNR